ncbi:MAG: hypothetical protein JSV95_09125 [Gemmatimonadota bacterium]|jgi:hypothetical protein|nr:MAG: hypothetical protein JSV95_09125 [Gemmatimonadota bacterium]
MSDLLSIKPDGLFELAGRAYQIPAQFSAREVYSYTRLLEPIPDVPGGTSLSDEQRSRQRAYLLRRAAVCVIPGLQMRALEPLPLPSLRTIHEWIAEHRPELSAAYQQLSA